MESMDGFDWDDGNRAKCQKHGVSLHEIEAVFANARIAPDLKHSDREDRYIAVGRNARSRPMFVAFVYRRFGDVVRIRPVSARYMHRKEAESYENEGS
ncbi:MAG: BrnT family toxin [Rhizobiales bacterium]|nr:BrnT family toxin [Hyphomicrobiales bacterium]MBN9008938.1 BrnT family toxin [Hyphomicrobiales bacterium]